MDLNRFDKCWFAIQVRPRHEFIAAAHLCHKGYEQFLPTYKVKRNWSDRQKEIELPLFPGYIFCRFDAQLRVPIVSTPGVVRVVGAHMPIAQGEMEAIQQVMSHGIPAEPCPYLKIGSKVQVTAGPLAGVCGILQVHKNQHRLILSVTLVENSISVEIDRKNVCLVPDKAPSIVVPGAVLPAPAPATWNCLNAEV